MLRDFLVRAHIAEIYDVRWSHQILDEFAISLKRRRPDLDPIRIDRTHTVLIEQFPEAMVRDYEDLIPLMRNDLDDRHVLAAAVKGHANVLVTFNVKHFPANACEPLKIQVLTPDQFLCRLWERDSKRMTNVLFLQAIDLSRPPKTLVQLVESLGRAAPSFADTVLASQQMDDQTL